DIDMRIDAALADEAEIGQALEQGRADLRPLADQHQRLGIAQAPRQRFNVLDVIVPDGDVVPVELGEAGQRAQRVEIVVEYGDPHAPAPPNTPNKDRRQYRAAATCRPAHTGTGHPAGQAVAGIT